MKNRLVKGIIFCLVVLIAPIVNGQELLEILEKETPTQPMYTLATFKANRVVLTQSLETRKKGTMEFTLGTRYWDIPNNDNGNSFVADRFSGHLGVQYAFSDRFTLGVGASSWDGVFNGFGKYRLLRQREDINVPLGITLVQNASYFSRNFSGFTLPENTSDRLIYTTQVIIGRKFDPNFSMQLAPTYIRSNRIQPIPGRSDMFLMGFGARYKLSNHVSMATEYGYLFGRNQGEEAFNLFSLGLNWEMGDLIMQFSMTNSKSFDDANSYLFNPNNFNFRPGRLHVGVNAIYVLHVKERKIKNLK